MADFITRSRLRAAAGSVYEQREVVRKAETASPTSATFLSHSSLDADLLPGAIRILEGAGARVYVDKKDNTLPPYTNVATAVALKGRIGASRKFVMLATPASKDSRWVPWELGLADASKSLNSVALLPSADSAGEQAWADREYLGIYDRIVEDREYSWKDAEYFVLSRSTGARRRLRDWLAA